MKAEVPQIGMLVTFTRRNHPFVPYGTGGVIDVVDPASSMFWVLTDAGGFFGWTTFDAWEWTGQKLPRTAESEGWFALREMGARSENRPVKSADQLDSQIAPALGKTPAQLVRAINSIVRAADGRNVYLVSTRLGSQNVRRVIGARVMPGTKGRGLDVRLLDTGIWQGVLPEMGDRIDVR